MNNKPCKARVTSISKCAISLFMGFLFSLFSCSSDDNPAGPPGADFTFPLTSGSQWQYSRTFKQFNVRGDSARAARFDTTISSNAVWDVVGPDTTVPDPPMPLSEIVLKETMTNSDGASFISENYYRNDESGLFLHAQKGAASVLLKSSPARLRFSGRYFHNTREILSFVETTVFQNRVAQDSLIIQNPPRKVLQYPLKIGSSWTVISSPLNVGKTVVGQEKVTVPAGEFNCLKIQLKTEIDDQIAFFDFISTEGLILRTILIRDIVVTTPDDPAGKDVIFDMQDEMQLVSFDLNK